MANNVYIHMDATDYNASKRSYIDLNYVPTLTTNVEITMKITNDTFHPGDTHLFGMNGNNAMYSPNGGYGARIRTNTSPNYYFEPTYGNSVRDNCWLMPVNTDFTIRFDQTTVAGKFTMYADGVVAQQWDLASSLQNLSLFLFSTNYINASSHAYAHPDEWVKEIKIYEGSTLARDYVPREQNGVVGLKDKVLGIFYAPTGTGKMVMEGTATPEIIPNPLPAQPHKQTIMFNCKNLNIKYNPIISLEKYNSIDFSKNLDRTLPLYGFLLRTDYQGSGELYFGKVPSPSVADWVPRMSLNFMGGAYTDTSFEDKKIKDNLPTMTYKGYTYYYYEFELTSYYNRNVGGEAYLPVYLKLITKINY